MHNYHADSISKRSQLCIVHYALCIEKVISQTPYFSTFLSASGARG